MDITARMQADALRVEGFLREHFRTLQEGLDHAAPTGLFEAAAYSLFAGGKRLRPALVLMTGRLLAGCDEPLLPLAAALEMIHTYSLIHDDLPAMDNDDLRRGLPTCHIKFGEAEAILAGDALLTEAFALAADLPGPPFHTAAVIRYLSRAAGFLGMVAGQSADLAAEAVPPDAAGLDFIHRHKTGALLRAAVVLPAIALGADRAEEEALAGYGEALGMVFQITDDLLDELGDVGELGKPIGSDREQGKTTFLTRYGVAGARRLAAEWGDRAGAALAPFGERAEELAALVRVMLDRKR